MQRPLAAVLQAVCERRHYPTVSVAVVPHLVSNPLTPLDPRLTRGKLYNLSGLWFLHLYNGCVCVSPVKLL